MKTLVQTVPSVVSKIEAKKRWGGWADLLRTQLKEFAPFYTIPNYAIQNIKDLLYQRASIANSF